MNAIGKFDPGGTGGPLGPRGNPLHITGEPTPRRRQGILVQFLAGIWAVPRGLHFLWTTPAAWHYALVPVLVCSALCALAVMGSIEFVPQLMAAIWPGLAQSIGRIGGGVAEFIGIVLTAILGMFLATFLTPPLSAPALERLVLVREADLGLLPRPAAGFWRETKAAIMAQVVALGVFTPVLVVLTMITWIAAPLAVVTVPLKFIVLAALLAWSLLDYPLSLRGASLRERVRLLLRGAPRVLGFGMAIALVFMVPLLPLLMLPVAVAAAAEIAVALEE